MALVIFWMLATDFMRCFTAEHRSGQVRAVGGRRHAQGCCCWPAQHRAGGARASCTSWRWPPILAGRPPPHRPRLHPQWGSPGAPSCLPARVDTPLAPSTALLQGIGEKGGAQRARPRAHFPNPSPPARCLTPGTRQRRSRPPPRGPAAAGARSESRRPAAAFCAFFLPPPSGCRHGDRRSSTGARDGPAPRVSPRCQLGSEIACPLCPLRIPGPLKIRLQVICRESQVMQAAPGHCGRRRRHSPPPQSTGPPPYSQTLPVQGPSLPNPYACSLGKLYSYIE